MKLFVRVTFFSCNVFGCTEVSFYCPGRCSAEGAASSFALHQCSCHRVSLRAIRPVYSYKMLF
jgi:hypothetical protein